MAVGSLHSSPELQLASVAQAITRELGGSAPEGHKVFSGWNEFIARTCSTPKRMEAAISIVKKIAADSSPSSVQRAAAAIPISNFIDLSIDGGLVRAMSAYGRRPHVEGYGGSQMIGSWRQRPCGEPTVFKVFPELNQFPVWYGLFEPVQRDPSVGIQTENRRDMLFGRDLVLLGIHPCEAQGILHLHTVSTAVDRIVSVSSHSPEDPYWLTAGAVIATFGEEELLEALMPYLPTGYSAWDKRLGRYLLDITKDREYDCFLSHYSGDSDFAIRLQRALELRSLRVWIDRDEIKIGDSISHQVQSGLTEAYTFAIVLTPEALVRPWVLEELRAATSLRIAGELPILPVVYRDCVLPPFLRDYRYADFRDPVRFEEQVEMLATSIQAAVQKARGKGDGRAGTATASW